MPAGGEEDGMQPTNASWRGGRWDATWAGMSPVLFVELREHGVFGLYM